MHLTTLAPLLWLGRVDDLAGRSDAERAGYVVGQFLGMGCCCLVVAGSIGGVLYLVLRKKKAPQGQPPAAPPPPQAPPP